MDGAPAVSSLFAARPRRAPPPTAPASGPGIAAPTHSHSPSYRRRQPEGSLLYRLVAAELPGLREALAAASPHGNGLPRHVDKDLDGFLACGLLHRGFARVVCHTCRAEHLVAFSCKGRGICPSCTTRRMHDTAAHLVDRVLPYAPYRQWVATFPRRVRYHLAADPKLASEALTLVLRVLFAWQRQRARSAGVRPARANSTGAISMVQRFNSALELSLHFHLLLPDGVFIPRDHHPDARPGLVEIDPPTDQDVAALLDRIITRVTAMLRRRGRLDDDALDDEPEPHLLLAARPVPRPTVPFVQEPLPPLCARKDGFSLHAATTVPKNDRQGLEHLCRYALRPPLAQGRLEEAPDGTILYTMKRRFSDGRHVLRFEPREFLLRLCALVPPRRFHMVRYAGIFAPHARGRFALTGRGLHDPPSTPPSTPSPSEPSPETPTAPIAPEHRPAQDPDDPTRQRRLNWAILLKRSFGLDVLACPRCGDRMELVSCIEDSVIAHRILNHLGLPTRGPPRPPPWRRQPNLPLPDCPHDHEYDYDCVDPPRRRRLSRPAVRDSLTPRLQRRRRTCRLTSSKCSLAHTRGGGC